MLSSVLSHVVRKWKNNLIIANLHPKHHNVDLVLNFPSYK